MAINTGEIHPDLPSYYLDVYGDATIAHVPPVCNYNYPENKPKRGFNDKTFRWEEVQIPLEYAESGLVNYRMPDEYIIQVTPDLGWHDTLSMFGDPGHETAENPHLVNIGPVSINNGALTDNADGSVQYTLTSGQFINSVIDGFPRYLWRAVAWGDGNPGYGGVPVKFEYVSKEEQLNFTVDEIIKETKRAVQVISGTKSPRVNITTEDFNNPSLLVDQTSTTWTVTFVIDRPSIDFTIVATDIGGSAVGKHKVDLEYEAFGQYNTHVWNAFDGHALAASVERLPGESNYELRERTIDAYLNKGGTHYRGLVYGANRELGLNRYDEAIKITRATGTYGLPIESTIEVESNHNRLSVMSPGLVRYDEIVRVDPYYRTITTKERVRNVLQIKTLANVELKKTDWQVQDHPTGKRIWIHPRYSGQIKITYTYKADVPFDDHPTLQDVVDAVNAIRNPAGIAVASAKLHPKTPGNLKADKLFKTYAVIDPEDPNAYVGWSRVGLYKISDEEYKWSFADNNSLFFDSDFYQYVLELKSKTNIEWGHIVADQDFWDAVDSDQYGRDSLPMAMDIPISHFVTAVPTKPDGALKFDPWEAHAMGYYYDTALIKNVGFPKVAFRSGVGFKKDCAVSVKTFTITADKGMINKNPVSSKAEDKLSVNKSDVADIIVDL